MSDVRTIFATRDEPPIQTPLALTAMCELCGEEGRLGIAIEGGAVSVFVGRYIEPRPPERAGEPPRRYERVCRCNDHQACRDRFEERTGEHWPFADRTTRAVVLLTTRAASEYATSLPSVLNEPVELAAPMEEDEDDWAGF